ncbi:MAG: hypothetical protein ACON34_11945 [Flavobacteriales bacterium]
MRWLLLSFLAFPLCNVAQSDSTRTVVTEKEMRQAAAHIVQFSGLKGGFVVRENPEVKSAVAFVKGKERWVEYNATFMSAMLDSSVTRWSAVSILAHEIGHHLMGHTLDPASLSVGNELECDHYSGFVLAKMGATLEDALAAMKLSGSAQGTATHPPKDARLEAISRGWHQANRQALQTLKEPFEPSNFLLRLTFVGDPQVYFADADSNLVWLDLSGTPLVLGPISTTTKGDYLYEFDWNDKHFLIDSRLKIWTLTPYNVWRQVGAVQELLP